ncbi:MAG TPA: porin, partial [Dehalococcoidia bacterium]
TGASAALAGQADGFQGAGAGAAEDLAEGFNLREAELAFTAAIDPYFDAAAFFAVAGDGIEAEEVYFQTRRLPAGLQVRGGKFRSGIGYINRQHPHQWDFVDQNFAYTLLLGHEGLTEKGFHASWLPKTPFYLLVGGEILQGENEHIANYIGPEEFPGVAPGDAPRTLSHQAGPRLFTGFMKLSPNLSYSHAMQAGLWAASSRKHQEVHDDSETGAPEAVLDGTAILWGLDFVYKYDSPRQHGAGDLTIQSEYLYRRRHLDVLGTPQAETFKNDGFYLQAVYGVFPRWQVAGRVSTAGLNNSWTDAAASRQWNTSTQYSAALTFNPTEFSRLRVQFNRDRVWVGGEASRANQVFVQFQMSMGAHGAHRF